MIPISKKLGLKLQETTQQVVKEMGMLLHSLLSHLSGLTVPAQQELLPEGISLQGIREIVPIIISGRGKTTIKEDRVVHLRRRHCVKGKKTRGVVVVGVRKGGKT